MKIIENVCANFTLSIEEEEDLHIFAFAIQMNSIWVCASDKIVQFCFHEFLKRNNSIWSNNLKQTLI